VDSRTSHLLAATLSAVLLALPGDGCAARARPVSVPAGPGAASPSVRLLQRDLDRAFGAPALDRTLWAVVVQAVDSGEVLYRLNPTKLVMPASNMKIVTLAASAERLGWEYAFETKLYATGPVERGVLRGDLLVVGAGDPTINGRGGSPRRVFLEWASRLKEAGITAIEGRVVGDDRAFDAEGLGRGWAWDYLADGYAAKVSALQYNEDLVGVVVRPGADVGSPASVELRPGGAGLSVENAVTTSAAGGEADLAVRRFPGSGRLRVSGSVPLGSDQASLTASVDAPAQFFVQELHDTLVGQGVLVRNAPAVWNQLAAPPAVETARFLFAHRSPPLSEIAVTLMKVSQNLYAETLLRALGAQAGNGSARNGQDVVREVLTGWGVAPDAYILADGSGLSRYNYVTADTIARILRQMAIDPRHAARFEATLPVVGKDGTLARRMKGTRAENNAKAKTGSISNVRALSGYVTTRDGERFIFSIIANNFNVPAAAIDAAVDTAVVRLAEFSRK
jgi:D-alanyl-D-alanine carboxypeptidase/D-alanyl-D-alanine-endopeptidase (penicillin-binding protein 4)